MITENTWQPGKRRDLLRVRLAQRPSTGFLGGRNAHRA